MIRSRASYWLGIAAGAGALGAAAGAYARFVEPARLETVTQPLVLPRWPRALDGVLLALIGDVHEGARGGRRWTAPALGDVVTAVDGARPDGIIVAGDYVFGQWNAQAVVDTLTGLRAPLRVGVLGNHDYGRGQQHANELALALEGAGFEMLFNQSRCLTVRDTSVWFSGFGDRATNHADVEVTMSQLPDDASPAIAITHVPDLADDLPPGKFDLFVSGHTHGGQIALPGLNNWVLRHQPGTRYNRGLYYVNGTPLCVTKGVGMVGYHARFRARPEVVFLRLHSRDCGDEVER